MTASCDHHRRPIDRDAFTIVELLVVIAIIGVLMALIVPAVSMTRESARRAQCKNNLRQMALAVVGYTEIHKDQLPPLWLSDRARPWNNFSWRVEILPFLERNGEYDRLRKDDLPLDPPNLSTAQVPIDIYECPSTPQSPRTIQNLGFAESQYNDVRVAAQDYAAIFEVKTPSRAFAAPGAWYGGAEKEITENSTAPAMDAERRSAVERSVPAFMAAIRDGFASTALIVEQAGKPEVLGTKPTTVPGAPSEGAWATSDYSIFHGDGINLDNYTDPFGFHTTVQAAMCDSSVHAWSPEIDPQILRSLMTRDGQEILQDSDWR